MKVLRVVKEYRVPNSMTMEQVRMAVEEAERRNVTKTELLAILGIGADEVPMGKIVRYSLSDA